MSNFRKKEKEQPAISTASLPDIVFMLLFFFMVITVMREQEDLVEQKLPLATQLQKLEQKSLVSYIRVGDPKDKAKYGKEPRIQTNDVLLTNLEEIQRFISEERAKLSEEDAAKITISLKADRDIDMNVVQDIRQQLREVDARKVSYAVNLDGDRLNE